MGVNKSAFGESLVEEHPLAHQYMHQATGVATNAAAEVVQKGRLNVNQLAQNAIGSAVGMHAGQVAGLGADSLTHHYYDKDRGAEHNVKPVQGAQRKQQQQAQRASSSRAREDVWVDLSDVMGDAKYHAGEPSYNGMFGRGHGTLGVSELHNQHIANPGLDISDASYQLSELNHKRMGQARQASPIATWSRDTAGLSVHDKVVYGAYLGASYYTGITQSVAHEALQTVHHIGSSIVNGITHPGDTLRDWHYQDVALRKAGFFLTLDTFMISGGLDQNNFAHNNMAARYDFAKEGVVNHVSTNWNKLTSGQSDLMGQGLFHFGWDAAALWSGRGVVTGAAELAYRGAVDLAVASKPVLRYGLEAAKRGVDTAKYGALYTAVEMVVKYPDRAGLSFFSKARFNSYSQIQEPFRVENLHYPADSHLTNLMNKMPIHDLSFDCSEIVDSLHAMNNNMGNKLKITPAINSYEVKIPEKINNSIASVSYRYHYVYEYNGYIYDPRLSSMAVPRGDYMQLLKQYNQPGYILEQEQSGEFGIKYKRIK